MGRERTKKTGDLLVFLKYIDSMFYSKISLSILTDQYTYGKLRSLHHSLITD